MYEWSHKGLWSKEKEMKAACSPQTSEERNVPHQVILLSCISEVFYIYCSLASNARTAVMLS